MVRMYDLLGACMEWIHRRLLTGSLDQALVGRAARRRLQGLAEEEPVAVPVAAS